MSMAMTIGPVAAATKSMIVWSSVFAAANPRVRRLDPDSRRELPRSCPLTP